MKKTLLLTAAFCASLIANEASAQTRYLDADFFSSVTVTSDVVYGNNLEVLTGEPIAKDLTMDIYEPAGDLLTDRPLIIYLHTGSFLPRYINQGLTGDKTDSATVEMCTRFAKQGYVPLRNFSDHSEQWHLGRDLAAEPSPAFSGFQINSIHFSVAKHVVWR